MLEGTVSEVQMTQDAETLGLNILGVDEALRAASEKAVKTLAERFSD